MPDPHLVDHRIIDLAPQPTVATRFSMPFSETDMGQLFREHMPRLFAAVSPSDLALNGAPYGRYFEFGPTTADIEIGVPVHQAPEGMRPLAQLPPGDIGVSALPAGPAAVVTFLGPYNRLGTAYTPFEEWIAAEGRIQDAGPWELYVEDPGAVEDHSKLKTEIYWPLQT